MVGRVAAIGLPATLEEAPLEVPRELWPDVLGRLIDQRLTGIAVAGVTSGRLHLDPAGRSELLDAHRRAMVLVLGLERKLRELAEAFEAAGVEVVVLKGPALARVHYPSPSWRPYGDLDLLIRTRDWRSACGLLAELGFRRLLPEPRPGFDERFGKGAAHEDDEGFQVDLHRTLAPGAFGLWIEPDRLFGRTAPLDVGVGTLRRLDDTAQFLHACLHAALGRRDPRLIPLRDVLQLAWSGLVDWDTLDADARTWRLAGPIRYALRVAAARLGVGLPDEAVPASTAEVGYVERRVLAAYTTRLRDAGGTALSAMLAIRGLGAKASYVRALAFPSEEFLVARGGGTRWSRLRIPISWVRGPFGRRREGAG